MGTEKKVIRMRRICVGLHFVFNMERSALEGLRAEELAIFYSQIPSCIDRVDTCFWNTIFSVRQIYRRNKNLALHVRGMLTHGHKLPRLARMQDR